MICNQSASSCRSFPLTCFPLLCFRGRDSYKPCAGPRARRLAPLALLLPHADQWEASHPPCHFRLPFPRRACHHELWLLKQVVSMPGWHGGPGERSKFAPATFCWFARKTKIFDEEKILSSSGALAKEVHVGCSAHHSPHLTSSVRSW